MKRIFFIIITILPIFLLSQSTKIYNKVAKKLENDKVAYTHFLSLGKKHCVKRGDFIYQYGADYNKMRIIPRLFDEYKLEAIFENYKNQHPKQKCNTIYAEKNKSARALYIKVIKNKNNYNHRVYEDLEIYMKEYLKYSKIKMPLTS